VECLLLTADKAVETKDLIVTAATLMIIAEVDHPILTEKEEGTGIGTEASEEREVAIETGPLE
jgi:hypothetical protein